MKFSGILEVWTDLKGKQLTTSIPSPHQVFFIPGFGWDRVNSVEPHFGFVLEAFDNPGVCQWVLSRSLLLTSPVRAGGAQGAGGRASPRDIPDLGTSRQDPELGVFGMNSLFCFAWLVCEAFPLSTKLLYQNTRVFSLFLSQFSPPSHGEELTQVKTPQSHRHSTHTHFFLVSCHPWKKMTLKYATESWEVRNCYTSLHKAKNHL